MAVGQPIYENEGDEMEESRVQFIALSHNEKSSVPIAFGPCSIFRSKATKVRDVVGNLITTRFWKPMAASNGFELDVFRIAHD